MDANQRRDIVADCTALMVRSFVLLDGRQYESLAGLFGVDGEWVRGGKPCVGAGEIMQSLNERPADIVIRHLLTNVDVSALGPDSAEGVGYFLVYKAKGDGGLPPLPAPLVAPEMVAEVHDRYQRRDGEWRIKQRKTKRIFE